MALGFKYQPRRKTYYVDGHEKPEVLVAHRKVHNNTYISDEIRCFRWIQLEEKDVEQLEEGDAKFTRSVG